MTGPTGMSAFTDRELAAYLDGTASADLRAAIDAALETDGTLLDRIAGLDRFAEVAAPAFDLLLRQAPTDSLIRGYAGAVAATDRDPAVVALRPPRRRHARWMVPTAFATGLAATFLLGIIAGRGPLDPFLQAVGFGTTPDVAEVTVPPVAPPPPSWLDAVADYARLFSAETFTSTPTDPETRRDQLAAVSGQVALDLSVVATDMPGLDLQRAEVLDLGGKPLGQVAYLTDSGRPVLLCILFRGVVNPAVGAPEFRTTERRGLNIVSWSAPRHGLLVIGDVPAADLEAIAATVADRLG